MNTQARRLALTRVRPPTKSHTWIRRVILAAVYLYVGLLIVTPLVALIVGAFQKGLMAIFVALSDPDVLGAFWRTLLISLVVVLVQGIFGTIIAWVIVRHRFRGKELLNGLIDMPFAVSAVVVGYMLLLVFGRNGKLAPILQPLHIQIAFALPGMVLATLFVTLPFMVRELIPVLQAFGISQEQAAATLGASGWQTFYRVTFPALRWGFLYGMVLTFARALGEFGAVLVVGGGVQGKTETTTLFIYRALEERQYVGAYSAALVLGLFSLFLVTGVEYLQKRNKEKQ